ncbi:hypothetical protein BDZ94DRAFT_1179069, partial [Collybia nuda]
YGTMLVGVFFNCILFGVCDCGCFIYYQTYSSDRLWLRLFVAYLALVEAVNTACDMYVVYQPLVLQFGKIEAVTFFPKTLSAAAVVTVLISTPVQIFMAWRISVIMGTKMVALIIAAFSLLSFAGGTWVTINVAVIKAFSKKNSFEFNRPGVVWFVASAITDVLITFTLVYSLHHRRTGHLKTTNAINRIIRLTVQTGLVTMIFALLDLLLFTLDSKTAISFVFDFSVSKLYTNALLSTLNARAGWSNLNNGDDDNVLFGTTAVRFIKGDSHASIPARLYLALPSELHQQ